MNRYILALILCVVSFLGGYYTNEFNFGNKKNTSDNIITKIDSILVERIVYSDSVRKKEEVLIYTAKKSNNLKIEKFNTFDKENKQKYLDSILEVDTIPRKYMLSDSQAVRIVRVIDSLPLLDSLYHIEARNADNCDTAMSKIDTLVDTLQVVVKQENKEAELKGFKKGSLISSITLVVLFGLILTFK